MTRVRRDEDFCFHCGKVARLDPFTAWCDDCTVFFYAHPLRPAIAPRYGRAS